MYSMCMSLKLYNVDATQNFMKPQKKLSFRQAVYTRIYKKNKIVFEAITCTLTIGN